MAFFLSLAWGQEGAVGVWSCGCHLGTKTTFTTARLLPRRRQWHPTPVLLPGKSHRQRSLVGCSPWGRKESDATSLSCTGEGNGNPLQCSCLENPRDRGAWWAAVYGAAQNRTWLKRLSSSSSCRRQPHWMSWRKVCSAILSERPMMLYLFSITDVLD